MPRPESEWVVQDRPDLRIIDEALWQQAQERRTRIRARYDRPDGFGKSRTEYGKYLLSGLLVCGRCGGSMTIRTSNGSSQKYGCTRRWRRGPRACTNSILIHRDAAEARVAALLQKKLYSPSAINRLVAKVNARLRTRAPAATAERERLLGELHRVGQELERLRTFIVEGDTSPRVRTWLAQAEQAEERLHLELERAEATIQRRPLQVHPGRVLPYLQDLRRTLEKGGLRARQLLQGDIERINVHPVLDAPKPFARAEVVTTGKGLLERVAFVVAGAGFERATLGYKRIPPKPSSPHP